MNEDYVSLEVAKLLKEKGFNWPCQAFYTKDGTLIVSPVHTINDEIAGSDIACPTLYMAHKWLREQGVCIIVNPHYTSKYQIVEYEYEIIHHFALFDGEKRKNLSLQYYEHYEQCLNDALLEALKLI